MSKNDKSNLNDDKTSNLIDEIFKNKIFFPLFSITVVAILVRIIYMDFEIPVTLDALKYFFYASDIAITGKIPIDYILANNGWPIFLGWIFSLFHFENVIEFMNLQKITSIIISSCTIIPIYILCRKFFPKSLSLIGSIIFAFEPHIIQNSLFGIADPLYIFLITTSLCLFIQKDRRLIFLAFAIGGIATIVRSEGMFLILALSIMFFIKFRKERLVIPKYIIALALFLIIILPMSYFKYDVEGNDAIFMRAGKTLVKHTNPNLDTGEPSGIPFFISGIENFPKYFIWNMIPIFGFFVPIGIYFVIREQNNENKIIIISSLIMAIPAFYAYSIPILDGRYFYFLYPLFCLISLFTIRKVIKKIPKEKTIFSCIIVGIIILSNVYLSLKIDNEHEMEALEIAKQISLSSKITNSYLPEGKYIEVVDLPDKWFEFKKFFDKRANDKSILSAIPHKVNTIILDEKKSIDEYVEFFKEKKMTHIIIDYENENEIFNDIYQNEEAYPYLIKQFDSGELQFKYELKVFKIDYLTYQKFN